MAKQEIEEPETEGEGEETPAGMSGMMKTLIIVAVVLVLEVIIIAVAIYMVQGSDNKVEVEQLETNKLEHDVLAIDDFFYNFQEGPNVNRRYHAEIYVVVEVEDLSDEATMNKIETFKVEVEGKKGSLGEATREVIGKAAPAELRSPSLSEVKSRLKDSYADILKGTTYEMKDIRVKKLNPLRVD